MSDPETVGPDFFQVLGNQNACTNGARYGIFYTSYKNFIQIFWVKKALKGSKDGNTILLTDSIIITGTSKLDAVD